MMTAALKSNKTFSLTRVAYHPYVVDMVISDSESSDNSTVLDEQSSVATVHKGKSLVVVIEVKKAVPAKFSMSEPSDVIELQIPNENIQSSDVIDRNLDRWI